MGDNADKRCSTFCGVQANFEAAIEGAKQRTVQEVDLMKEAVAEAAAATPKPSAAKAAAALDCGAVVDVDQVTFSITATPNGDHTETHADAMKTPKAKGSLFGRLAAGVGGIGGGGTPKICAWGGGTPRGVKQGAIATPRGVAGNAGGSSSGGKGALSREASDTGVGQDVSRGGAAAAGEWLRRGSMAPTTAAAVGVAPLSGSRSTLSRDESGRGLGEDASAAGAGWGTASGILTAVEGRILEKIAAVCAPAPVASSRLLGLQQQKKTASSGGSGSVLGGGSSITGAPAREATSGLGERKERVQDGKGHPQGAASGAGALAEGVGTKAGSGRFGSKGGSTGAATGSMSSRKGGVFRI